MVFWRRLKNLATGHPNPIMANTVKVENKRLPVDRAEGFPLPVTGPFIEFFRGSRKGKRLPLRGTAWRVGSAPSSEILFDRVQDAEVDAHHADLIFEDDDFIGSFP